MVMVPKEDVPTDPDWIEALGAAEDAEDNLVELGRGSEQEASLHGAAGDLNESPF
jgi:hypothetical protein